MREILFRGKSVNNGEWVEGFLVVDTIFCEDSVPVKHYHIDEMNLGTFPVEFQSGISETVDPETVGQYTGLTDKNGKKIFEGDICLNDRSNEIVSVKWHGTMAGFVWSKRKEKSYLFDFGELFRVHDKYEVIGNIHDNPELLEGGAEDAK